MSLLPVKIRILQLIKYHEGISNEDLLANLKKEYGLGRNLTEKGIEDYLISLKAVGMIGLTDIILDESGRLKQFYKITKYGAERMKHLVGKKKPPDQLKLPV
ncbi:MAG: hypothetical protein ACOWWO_00830 [Peptococcaceae bacterium]